MVLCFSSDDQTLLVGDKTGEAQCYKLLGGQDQDWTGESGVHLLGHFSMLLDMVEIVENLRLLGFIFVTGDVS